MPAAKCRTCQKDIAALILILISFGIASNCCFAQVPSFSEWNAKHYPGAASQPAQLALPVTGPKVKDVSGYTIIPLKGTFGDEINAELFQMSVNEAIKSGAKYVFIDLDSNGGNVQTAEDIAKIMQKASRQLKFYCWVEEKAFSASIWVTFSSDALFMNEQSMVGAAVAFKRDDAGVAQVSKKFNSAVAAKIVANAETKGYPAPIIRAMVQEGSEAYAWRSNDGQWHIENTKRHQGAKEFITLSNGQTILTMTGRECANIGLAEICTSMEEMRKKTGIPNLLKVTATPEELAIIYCEMRAKTDLSNHDEKYRLPTYDSPTYDQEGRMVLPAPLHEPPTPKFLERNVDAAT